MLTWLQDSNKYQNYNGSAWVDLVGGSSPGILQVVSTTKTDVFSTSASSPTAITGASVSITPSSASSKIFVSFDTVTSSSSLTSIAFQLFRDSTNVGGGLGSGSRRSAIATTTNSTDYRNIVSGSFLDAPATTSAITYSLQVFGNGATVWIGRGDFDADNNGASSTRTPLTITAMEVAG
jgi:hypothetical protein